MTFEHQIQGPSGGVTWHRIFAMSEGQKIGLLKWSEGDSRKPQIDQVWVHEDHRRQGVASQMLVRAREVSPDLTHGVQLSPDGAAWSQAVGSKTAGPGGGVVPHRFRYKGPQWNLQQARPVVVAPQAMQDIKKDITPRERIKVWEAIAAIEEGRARLEPKKRGPLVGTYGLRIDEDCRLLVYPNVDGKWHLFWVGQHTYGEAERRMAKVAGSFGGRTERVGPLYHGTTDAFARRILSEGFVGNADRKGVIYLTESLSLAWSYAQRVVQREGGGEPAVLRIEAVEGVPSTWVGYMDFDLARGAGADYSPMHGELVVLNLSAIKGPITREQVSVEGSLETEARSGGDDRGSAKDRRARKVWLLNHFGTGYAVKCHYCPRILDYDTVEADRVIPGEEGGRYVRENIVPACRQCNASRGHDTNWVLDWDEMWEEYGLERAATSAALTFTQQVSGKTVEILAHQGGSQVGRLSIYDAGSGWPIVGMVEVDSSARRQGVASAMAQEYHRLYPGDVILHGGDISDAGRAWATSLPEEWNHTTEASKTKVSLDSLKFDPSWGDAVDRYQYNYRARVTLPDGSQVASMEVSWFKHPSYAPEGEAKVEMIEVDEEYRRQGIAAWLYQKMIDHIRSEQSGWDLKDLQHSYMTEDGLALWRSVGPRLSYGEWEDLHTEFPLRGTQRNKVYRAIVFDDIENLPAAQRAQIVQQRLETRQSSNRWSHWTWDEEWAEHFATELAAPNYDEKGAWREGLTRVVVEAFLDRSDVEWDPAVLERLRNGFDLPEPEVILRPGSRVYVEAIRIHDHAYSWETFPVRRKVVASKTAMPRDEGLIGGLAFDHFTYSSGQDIQAIVAYDPATHDVYGHLTVRCPAYLPTSKNARTETMWVNPQARRRGIASELMSRAKRLYPNLGLDTRVTPDGRAWSRSQQGWDEGAAEETGWLDPAAAHDHILDIWYGQKQIGKTKVAATV